MLFIVDVGSWLQPAQSKHSLCFVRLLTEHMVKELTRALTEQGQVWPVTVSSNIHHSVKHQAGLQLHLCSFSGNNGLCCHSTNNDLVMLWEACQTCKTQHKSTFLFLELNNASTHHFSFHIRAMLFNNF